MGWYVLSITFNNLLHIFKCQYKYESAVCLHLHVSTKMYAHFKFKYVQVTVSSRIACESLFFVFAKQDLWRRARYRFFKQLMVSTQSCQKEKKTSLANIQAKQQSLHLDHDLSMFITDSWVQCNFFQFNEIQ